MAATSGVSLPISNEPALPDTLVSPAPRHIDTLRLLLTQTMILPPGAQMRTVIPCHLSWDFPPELFYGKGDMKELTHMGTSRGGILG